MIGVGAAKPILLVLVFTVLILIGHEYAGIRESVIPETTLHTSKRSVAHPSGNIVSLQDDHTHPAAQFVWERFKAYQAVGDGDRWRFRGLGYLFVERGMILEASVVPAEETSKQRVVRIENIRSASTIECERLSVWVRVNGPEIFAGKPQVVKEATNCWWEFPVVLSKSGTYDVEAKLLTWNGDVSIVGHPTNAKTKTPDVQCPMAPGGAESMLAEDIYDGKNHSSIWAFKLYQPIHGCCEYCTRQYPFCIGWATPPSLSSWNATHFDNGCEFVFSDNAPASPRSKHLDQRRRSLGGNIPHFYGAPHDRPDQAAYFMGCGWSSWFTLDFPCLSGDLDDRIHVSSPQFIYNGAEEATERSLERLPLCTLEDEHFAATSSSFPHSGRWLRRPFPNNTECPVAMKRDENFKSKFAITQFDPDHPECWHRDDFSVIGQKCMEMNCRLIPPHSIWRSAVHNTTAEYVVWKPYECDYIELTDNELQTCIDAKGIGKIKRNGASVSEFLEQYLLQRLQNIRMVENGGKTITLSTLALLHHVGTRDDAFLNEKDLKILLEEDEENGTVFWVSGYFLSSERTVHAHVDRMDWVNRQVMQRFPESRMLNSFDLSAAFTYDTATQMDGMHIIGPPMKMIITKLFHHLCKDVVPDARRVGYGW